MEEVWKTVPGHERYEVSSLGRVRSNRRQRPKDMLPTISKVGYPVVRMDEQTVYVHTLVLSAFVGPRPHPMAEAAHYNGVKTDNRLENLRWATRSENTEDKRRHNTMPLGEQVACAKLRSSDVVKIRAEREGGAKIKSIASRFGVNQSTISRVVGGKRWGHI